MFSKLACVHRTLKAGIHILCETVLLPMLKLLLNLSCFIANHIFIAGMKHSTRPLLSCSCKSKPYSIFLLAGSRARLLLPFMVIKHIQLFPPSVAAFFPLFFPSLSHSKKDIPSSAKQLQNSSTTFFLSPITLTTSWKHLMRRQWNINTVFRSRVSFRPRATGNKEKPHKNSRSSAALYDKLSLYGPQNISSQNKAQIRLEALRMILITPWYKQSVQRVSKKAGETQLNLTIWPTYKQPPHSAIKQT